MFFGEALAGIAVLVSLFLLTVEISENTKAVRYQIESERIDRIRNAADSPYIPSIVAKVKKVDAGNIEPATAAFQETYGLTLVEADRFSRHLGSIWEGLQADYHFGIRDVAYIQELFKYPDQDIYWSVSRDRFESCFVEWVDMIHAGEETLPAVSTNPFQQLLHWLTPVDEAASGECQNRP